MDDRDPVVARALAAVQPPQHRADFWQRLDRALATTAPERPPMPMPVAPPPAPALERVDDTTVVELHRASGADGERGDGRDGHHGRTRRGARFPLRLLASAAVIVAVVAAGVLVASRGDDEGGPDLSTAGPSDTVAEGTEQPVAPETTAPTVTTIPGDPMASPDGVVLAFVDALGRGDHDEAASFIGPLSEQRMIEQWGSVDAYLTEASEGHGAWSAAENRTVDVIELRAGEAVVVLRGTIRPEGMVENRTAAFPVRRTESAGGYWFVEPVAYGDECCGTIDPDALETEGTQDDRVVTNGEAVVLRTPTAGTAYFFLGTGEGGTAVPVETTATGTGHHASWTPTGVPTGPSVLTVAFVSDGQFGALAVPVTVR